MPKEKLETNILKKVFSTAFQLPTLHLHKGEFNVGAHFLTPEQLETVFRTNCKTGLSETVAKDLYDLHGPNKLKEIKGESYLTVFRRNVFGWFQCVLWIGAILNFIMYACADVIDDGSHAQNEYLYLGCVITATILGTGLFGFYVEARNLSVMSGFEKLVPPNAMVIREKVKKKVPVTDIVIGDIVEMTGGEVVPADVRILRCSQFKTDMSSITGESNPICHRPECTNKNPLESRNMAYFGCHITEGTARGLVIATGENTEIGKIAGLVSGLVKEETPIAKEIKHFVKLICYVSFFFGGIFLIMVYMIQKSWLIALQYMLGIILANVPEGLLVTLTVCFTLSAKQLKKKNCLAKSLQAVETLGSVSVICTDKTGTLTENKMRLSHLYCNDEILDKGDKTHVTEPAFQGLCLAACLNLRASFDVTDDGNPIEKRKIIGDASEGAILRYMEEHHSATKRRETHPKEAEIPFNSTFKYQISIHQLPNNGTYYMVMKGAPEIVIENCITWLNNNGEEPLNNTTKKAIQESFIKLANMGERVIGYADLYLPPELFPHGFKFDTQNVNFPKEKLRFIGAISMIDPPRQNIEKYIDLCRQAGIKVVMVTGDHPVTALAIARQCKIITAPTPFDYAFEHKIEVSDVPKQISKHMSAIVITGDDLHKMSNRHIEETILRYNEIVFARTSPKQKLLIVENYQALEYVVAVTGDGVNDSPALKKADIGIAMGITGTEVSKQAADMILIDDNFASIVLGIEEGRRIFDNLKKTIAYTLTSNTPEMMPFIMYALLGLPLPLTLILILVVNVGTDLLPAMSLAYETSEMDIMSIPPRKSTDHLVTRVLLFMAYFQVGLIQFFAGMYAYFITFATEAWFPMSLLFIRDKWDSNKILVQDSIGRSWSYADRKRLEKKAQTSYFVALCWTQISDVIICKTRRISLLKKGMYNHVLNLAIVIDLVAAVCVTYVPACNMVFGTQPLKYYDFLLALPFIIIMILGDELRRLIIRRNYSKFVEEETYY